MNDPVPYHIASDKLGFYIAASDQDMLAQINRLLSRSGCIGNMDTAGRLQYLVDGRRGPPFAARRIEETTARLIQDRQGQDGPLRQQLASAADQVLAAHAIRQELEGCRYLRYLLLLAGLDETRLRPISKTLYPAAASHFRVTASQVERDIRYALAKSGFQRLGLTSTAAVCRMHDEMIRIAGDLKNKETPSACCAAGEGRCPHSENPSRRQVSDQADWPGESAERGTDDG